MVHPKVFSTSVQLSTAIYGNGGACRDKSLWLLFRSVSPYDILTQILEEFTGGQGILSWCVVETAYFLPFT